MKAQDVSSLQRVTDPVAVRLILHERVRQVLSRFLEEENTVAQVARQTGLDIRVVHRDVRALLAAGLLVQTREQARAGRDIRHYRSVARAYFVPFSASAAADLADWHRAPYAELDAMFHAAAEREFERALREHGGGREWGLRLYTGPTGPQTDEGYVDAELREPLSGWQGPPALMLRGSPVVRLSDAQAGEVQRDLIMLMMRLRDLDTQNAASGAGRPFMLQLGLAPLTAEEQAALRR